MELSNIMINICDKYNIIDDHRNYILNICKYAYNNKFIDNNMIINNDMIIKIIPPISSG